LSNLLPSSITTFCFPLKTNTDDTWFYVAALNDDAVVPETSPDVGVGEATICAWHTPREALDLATANKIMLAPPQLYILSELLQYQTIAQVLEAARNRHIVPVRAEITLDGNDLSILLEGDENHSSSSESSSSPTQYSGCKHRVTLNVKSRAWAIHKSPCITLHPSKL
jgi:hypothetical protein